MKKIIIYMFLKITKFAKKLLNAKNKNKRITNSRSQKCNR